MITTTKTRFTLQHRNITFKVTHDTKHADDATSDDVAKLGYGLYTFPEELFDLFKLDEDGLHCADLMGADELESCWENTNPDLFLSFCCWVISAYPDTPVEVAVTVEHPYWIFHDICHIESLDLVGCEGNITAQVETYQLEEGFNSMAKHGMFTMSFYYGMLLEESFLRRFKRPLNFHKFYTEEL